MIGGTRGSASVKVAKAPANGVPSVGATSSPTAASGLSVTFAGDSATAGLFTVPASLIVIVTL